MFLVAKQQGQTEQLQIFNPKVHVMNKGYLCCMLFVFGFLLIAKAQDKPDWEFHFEGEIKQHFSEATFQLYYNYDGNYLTAFDYLEQKMLWSQSIPGLKEAKRYSISGYPLLCLTDASFSENARKGIRMVIIQCFTGEVLFDAEWTDFENIKAYNIFPNVGMVLLRGKENKINTLAIAEFGERGLKWKRKMPGNSKGLNLSLDKDKDKFQIEPISSKHKVVFAYGDTLFALNTENGLVAWEKPLKEKNIAFIIVRNNDPDPHIFYVHEKPGDSWALNAYNIEDFTLAWEKPYLLVGKHYIHFGSEEILIRMENTFNYIDYAGKPKWLAPPQFSYPIKKLFQQGEEFLTWMINVELNKGGNDTTYFVNWLDNAQQIQFDQPVAVKGEDLRMGKKLGDRLILVTNEEIAVIDMQKGKRITAAEIPCENCLYVIDSVQSQIVFYSRNQLIALNYRDGSWEQLAEKIKWKKDEQPQALKIIPSGYGLIAPRQLLVYSPDGELFFENYYPETLKPMGIIEGVIKAAGSILLSKEMAAINRFAYETDLIDSEEYMNNAMAMAINKDVGSVLVGSSFAERLIAGNGKKEQAPTIQRLENLWLINDKLDDRQFGLRVFDLSSLKEEKTIWLADNEDFGFWTEPKLGGIMRRVGGKLMFYKL